jgi:hypothetical protein
MLRRLPGLLLLAALGGCAATAIRRLSMQLRSRILFLSPPDDIHLGLSPLYIFTCIVQFFC